MSGTAIIYTRVSSSDQVRGTSLDSQLADCRLYAQRRALEVVEVFTDAGISAKTVAARPQLLAALDYCRKHRPAALIVHKLDRLARNASEALVVRTKLRGWGVDVLSATEAVTVDPAGDLLSTIILGVAEFDNAQRAQRVRRGMAETAKRGGWPFRPPIGYRRAWTDDGLPVLEIDGDRGRAIGAALRMYADGAATKHDLYQRLEQLGLPHGGIASAIRCPALAGIVVGKATDDQPVRGKWEPMLTVRQHEAIVRNTRRQKAKDPSHLHSAMQGILHCAVCGRTMTAYWSKGHVYHKCNNRACQVSISETKAAEELRRLLAETQIHVILGELARRLRALAQKQTQALASRRRAAAAAAERQRRKLDRLTDLYLEGDIPRDEYNEKAAALRTAIADAEAPAADAAAVAARIVSAVNAAADKLADPVTFLEALPVDRAKSVLAALFGSISVNGDKKCAVTSNGAIDSIYSLICQKSDTNLDWWAKLSPGLTRLGELCQIVARAG